MSTFFTDLILDSPKQRVREVGIQSQDSTAHWQRMEDMVRARVDTAEENYSSDLDKYLERGLSSKYARAAMMAGSRNNMTSPQNCPPWLCCILPCLNGTPTMKRWRECLADEASIVRGGRTINIDADSLIVGDIVTVKAGEVAPADIRITMLEANTWADRSLVGPALVDAFALAGNAQAQGSTALDAPNMLYAGFRLTSGKCTGIVVGTGQNTVLSRLVVAGHF